MSRPLQAVLLIVGTALAWGAFFLTKDLREQSSPVAAETIQDKQASVEAAFTGKAVDVEDEEVERFVHDLHAKVLAGDTEGIRKLLDMERTVMAMTMDLPKEVPSFVRSQLSSMLSDEVTNLFDDTMTRLEIRRIERDEQNNVVVYIVFFDDEQTQFKERWWLHDGGDGLRWWDNEQLEMGLRLSTIMSVSIAAAMAGDGEAAITRLQELTPYIETFDPYDVEQATKVVAITESIPMDGLPKSLRHLVLMIQAAAYVGLEQPEQLLATLDRLEQDRMAPFDVPMRHHLRAVALVQLERWDEAVTAEQTFIDLLGDDADAYYVLGTAELGRDKAEAALAAFENGIATHSRLPDNFAGAASATTDHAKLVALLKLAPDTTVIDAAAELLPDPDEAARFDKAAAEAHPGWEPPTTP